MAEDTKEVKGKAADEKLIADACEAYGIAPKYVLGSAVKDGLATIVTHGGVKVKYRKGDEVEKLPAIKVSGIDPNAKPRKPITGGAKK